MIVCECGGCTYCQLLRRAEKAEAEVERLQRENIELSKDKETLSCGCESHLLAIERLRDDLMKANHMAGSYQHIAHENLKLVERLRKLCGEAGKSMPGPECSCLYDRTCPVCLSWGRLKDALDAAGRGEG